MCRFVLCLLVMSACILPAVGDDKPVPGDEFVGKVITLREPNQQPERCVVRRVLRYPDGSFTVFAESLETGEHLTIERTSAAFLTNSSVRVEHASVKPPEKSKPMPKLAAAPMTSEKTKRSPKVEMITLRPAPPKVVAAAHADEKTARQSSVSIVKPVQHVAAAPAVKPPMQKTEASAPTWRQSWGNAEEAPPSSADPLMNPEWYLQAKKGRADRKKVAAPMPPESKPTEVKTPAMTMAAPPPEEPKVESTIHHIDPHAPAKQVARPESSKGVQSAPEIRTPFEDSGRATLPAPHRPIGHTIASLAKVEAKPARQRNPYVR